MELLLLRVGLGEEERTSISRFLSGLNMEVRDKVELFPYRHLDAIDLQEAKYFIDEEDPRPTTSTWS